MTCRRYGVDGTDLDFTVVGGQASMHHREWPGPDEVAIKDQACKTASKPWQRI